LARQELAGAVDVAGDQMPSQRLGQGQGRLQVQPAARTPRPGPQLLELPGEESPAVVAMLTDDWEVGREAVPATLIDLAARKIVAEVKQVA